MARIFGFVLMLIAMYVGMEIYSKGIENTLYGAFGPTEATARKAPGATGDASSDRPVPITDRVRQQVTSDFAAGAHRYDSQSQD